MNLQLWAGVAAVVASFVGAALYQPHHVDRRFEAMEKRFGDLRNDIGHRVAAIDKRFDDLKDWIRAELRRIDDRLDRLEHPIVGKEG